MADSSKCVCFPESKEFKKQYFGKLDDGYLADGYLAEKTWPTIDKWTSNKKSFVNIDLLPVYAVYDYLDKICKESTKSACQVSKMYANTDLEKISSVLHEIKFPCACSDD